MKTNIFGKTLHTLHFHKVSKPLVIGISALLILSMAAMLSVTSVSAAPPASMALHTSGKQILDANNNVVYLRGVGLPGFAPNILFWGPNGPDNWGCQWNYNPTTMMDQTFAAMRIQWHINMIRVFVLPKLVLPRQHSTRTGKLQLRILNNPDKHQSIPTNPLPRSRQIRHLRRHSPIHVDTVTQAPMDKDPYATSDAGWQGLPMTQWDTPAKNFLNAAGYGSNEQGFWQWFWTDMANNLKGYPNAIFEPWNEPGPKRRDLEPIPADT